MLPLQSKSHDALYSTCNHGLGCSNGSKEAIAARLAEEEEMAKRIEERVRERVAQALESEEVQRQIEARLREERTALEQKVSHAG